MIMLTVEEYMDLLERCVRDAIGPTVSTWHPEDLGHQVEACTAVIGSMANWLHDRERRSRASDLSDPQAGELL